MQGRSRTCTNPPPAFGGAQCTGSSDATRTCNEEPCPGTGMMIQSIQFIFFNHFEIYMSYYNDCIACLYLANDTVYKLYWTIY